MVCGYCGCQNNDGVKFCSNCGAKMNAGNPSSADNAEKIRNIANENIQMFREDVKRFRSKSARPIVIFLIFFSIITVIFTVLPMIFFGVATKKLSKKADVQKNRQSFVSTVQETMPAVADHNLTDDELSAQLNYYQILDSLCSDTEWDEYTDDGMDYLHFSGKIRIGEEKLDIIFRITDDYHLEFVRTIKGDEVYEGDDYKNDYMLTSLFSFATNVYDW